MSGDYSEVSSQGWLSRIMDSIKGVLIGLLLFLISFVVLGWNEYNSVTTSNTIAEGRGLVIDVKPDKVEQENDGKLVHFSGKATTDETLTDGDFGVSSEKTIRLSRRVEMFQWKEEVHTKTEKKIGGGEQKVTTYTYTKVWSATPIDSSSFNPKGRQAKEETGVVVANPPMPFQSKNYTAGKVTVGAFRLPGELVNKIDKPEPLSVRDGGKQGIEVAADRIDPANKGKVVRVKGKLTGDAETLKDDVFGVSAENAIRLHRKVEMYQWQQLALGTEREVTGYAYEKNWVEMPTDSAKFDATGRMEKQKETGEEITNPPMVYQTRLFPEPWVEIKTRIGAFELSPWLLNELEQPYPVTATGKGTEGFLVVEDGSLYKGATPLSPKVGDVRVRYFVVRPGEVSVTGQQVGKRLELVDRGGEAKGPAGFHVQGNGFYKGANPDSPKVGDVRVTFTVVKPTEVSVLAKQYNDTLEAYHARAGRNIFELTTGEVSADAMFTEMEKKNTFLTWILRLVGFVLMAVGLFLMVNPLVVIADVLPFLGNLLSTGAMIFAIVLALPLTLLTIGIAWVAVRPMVGIPLLIGGIAIIVGAVFLFKGKKKPA